MATITTKSDISESSSNVFLDLGYSSEDAEILRMRADLMSEVRGWIKENGLTQAQAAEILHVSQSRISDLVRGKWEKFSLEMLIILAMRCDVGFYVCGVSEKTIGGGGCRPDQLRNRIRRPRRSRSGTEL